jgi:hypothetical protein
MRDYYQIIVTFRILQITFKMAATICLRGTILTKKLTDLQACHKVSLSVGSVCLSGTVATEKDIENLK